MSTALIKHTAKAPAALRWYLFNQNNSGGRFERDLYVDERVFVQAYSAEEANEIAEGLGIYFDGCSDGRDCSCCGDRWYPVWDNTQGLEVPTIYGDVLDTDCFEVERSAKTTVVLHDYAGGIMYTSWSYQWR